MSIETVASTISSVEHDEESPEEAKLRERVAQREKFHDDIGASVMRLHTLQTRHQTLYLGLLDSSQTYDQHTHDAMTQERDSLAKDIHDLRQEQGELLTKTALYNTTIERTQDNGSEQQKSKRRQEEQPYVNVIHNNGVDPKDIAPNDSNGHMRHYLENAAL